MSVPLEHDYIGLSEASLTERSSEKISSSSSNHVADVLNLKETELRLGLPGSASPERKDLNNLTSRAKRGFSDGGKKAIPSNENSAPQSSKAQVVGWPPIRSFRKNNLATASSKNNDAERKSSSDCLYVKVRMDGAPYLRKVDIKLYSNYTELSSALEKMFSCFSIGQCAGDRVPGEEELSESHLLDLLNGSEYVLTYEDKDGDWMLVGDVPWEMFIGSCKRLRIMRSSDAIGLAPRAINKCKNQH